ncbi:MAG: AI-2E family transporter [Blastochloris sp.]|nr:AI-2E family transporter [Blastochloris sp.]
MIGGTLLAVFLCDWMWWISIPLVASVVLYYIALPIIEWLERRGLDHSKALWVFILGLTLLAAVLGPALLSWFTTQAYLVQEKLPAVLNRINETLGSSIMGMEEEYLWMQEAEVGKKINAKLELFKEGFVESYLPNVVVYVLHWVPCMLLVPYLTFFFLKDAHRLKKLLMRGVPNAFFEKVLLLFHRLDGQVKKYFCGLMMMTLLDTVTLALGLWVLGLNFGVFGIVPSIFLGLLCAVLSWLPFIGSVVGCLVIVLVCVIQSAEPAWLVFWAVILFVSVRLLDDFLYTPMTIGRSLSVHPLVTVLMIFAGGFVGGVTGLLLVMPVLGVAMVLGEIFGQVWFDARLRARYHWGRQLRLRAAREGLSG